MLCTISPEALDYEETLSTLRYANNAKKVVNKVIYVSPGLVLLLTILILQAVVNEDSTQKLISQLRGEINELSQKLGNTQR